MNVLEHLFTTLSEESAEIGQICCKINRFGIYDKYQDQTNLERLEKEIDDLLAVVEMLNENGVKVSVGNRDNIRQKKQKVCEHMEHARTRGLIVD